MLQTGTVENGNSKGLQNKTEAFLHVSKACINDFYFIFQQYIVYVL